MWSVPALSAAIKIAPGMVPSWQAFSKEASMDNILEDIDEGIEGWV